MTLDDLLELGIAVGGIGIHRTVLVSDDLEGSVFAGKAFGILGDSGFKKVVFLFVWLAVAVRTAENVEELLVGLGQELFIRVAALIGTLLIDVDGGAADVVVSADLAFGGPLRKFIDNEHPTDALHTEPGFSRVVSSRMKYCSSSASIDSSFTIRKNAITVSSRSLRQSILGRVRKR